MKQRTFNVPVDSTVEFAELLDEYGLEGIIIGKNDDDELLVKVEYEPEEDSQAILEIIEHIENLDGEYSEEDDE
ncbi:hypothetical protein [Geofilum rhodophaeum]|uniref:hypothetical protein n=1 Tax=Geofilum rhodophaeum TaxID=1965019 RepID=UPI000B521BDF|nr:hypothetical protein [Geofilum rhodophaeum]